MGFPMRTITIFFLLLFVSFLMVSGQELNARVSVTAPSLAGDKSALTQMETDITNYLNNRKWTNDQYSAQERIKCTFTIIITQGSQAGGEYKGTIQVQAIRPVYKSNFETLTLNYEDKDFTINYLPQQPLEFSENTYLSNLTSILNFYAYLIIGLDYDSFSPLSGTKFYQQAQNQVNLASTSNQAGWSSTGSDRARYWVIENLLNNSYRTIRDISYKYHRLGMDKAETDLNECRKIIAGCIKDLQKLYQLNPGVLAIRVFLDAKKSELVNIFKGGSDEQKNQFINVMQEIDPGNMNQYYNKVFDNK